MSLDDGSVRPPPREQGTGRSRPGDLRQRATPGLVPAPLVGMAGANVPPDSGQGRTRSVDEGTDAHRALATICPYLVAEDGGWRAAEPMREHRCTAVRPPAPLSDETQRRLCLVEAHVTCPDYLAARQRRAAELAKDRIALEHLDTLRFQPGVRAVPVVLERPRAGARSLASDPSSILRKVRLPAAAAVLIIAVLFGASVLMGGFAPRPSGPAGPGASASGIGRPSPSATSVGASPSTSAGASGSAATASPSPSASIRTTTYRVRRGDSLSRIARRFGTTVAVLKALNGIKDPPRIRVGQVLKVPAPAE